MSESELLQLYAEMNSSIAPSIALYITVLFGYFVVAHIVGRKLTTVEIVSANTVYTLVMGLGLTQLHRDITVLSVISNELAALESKFVGQMVFSEWTPLVVTLIYFFAFIISLLFMHHSRRRDT